VSDFLVKLFDIIVHLDRYVIDLINQYGLWTYLILFVTIFCETGLVVTPFFPGDSLVFAVGALAAVGELNIFGLFLILSLAAFLGNISNYWIGRKVGLAVFKREKKRFLSLEYMEKTRDFYEKYGNMTIVIARFLPFIRTFAPFIAGISRMTYLRFLIYSFIGCVCWAFLFLLGGYLFGNIPVVKQNFSLVIIIIIVISLVPSFVAYWRKRRTRIQNP
jgi:membrane-associated protein